MFDNTVKLADYSTTLTETSIVDGPTNRRTIRVSADGKTTLTIAHTESNENPGFTNQRSNVRVEKLIELPDTDKTLKAYVQFTFSFPKDHVTVTDIKKAVAELVNFLAYAENSSSEVAFSESVPQTGVIRLYAGEP